MDHLCFGMSCFTKIVILWGYPHVQSQLTTILNMICLMTCSYVFWLLSQWLCWISLHFTGAALGGWSTLWRAKCSVGVFMATWWLFLSWTFSMAELGAWGSPTGYMELSSNRATPSHPFSMGIFHESSESGIPPWLRKPPGLQRIATCPARSGPGGARWPVKYWYPLVI